MRGAQNSDGFTSNLSSEIRYTVPLTTLPTGTFFSYRMTTEEKVVSHYRDTKNSSLSSSVTMVTTAKRNTYLDL